MTSMNSMKLVVGHPTEKAQAQLLATTQKNELRTTTNNFQSARARDGKPTRVCGQAFALRLLGVEPQGKAPRRFEVTSGRACNHA